MNRIGNYLISLSLAASIVLAAIASFVQANLGQFGWTTARAYGIAGALLAAFGAILASYHFLQVERDKHDSEYITAAAALLNIVIFLSGGILAVLAAAAHWATTLFWSLGALLAGGFLGMLLSLPSSDDEAGHNAIGNSTAQAGDPPDPSRGVSPNQTAKKRQITALGRVAARVNQIVGGGIAFNWKDFYAEIKKIALHVGVASGLDGSNAVAGAGLLLFFGLLGLISGILLTRIFLNHWLSSDDCQ